MVEPGSRAAAVVALSVDPGKIAQHDDTHGKGAHRGAGSWLANTLAWIPLFILTLALAARPDLDAAWNNAVGLSLPAHRFPLLVQVPYLLLTGIASAVPNDDIQEVLSVVAVVVTVGVAVFVAGFIEDAIKNGQPTLITRAIIPILAICYTVIAWVAFTAPVIQ